MRVFARPEDLTLLVRDVFGTHRRLVTLDRLTGGTMKGVYRLSLDDGFRAVLYVWHQDENYWPVVDGDGGFGDSHGLAAFEAVHAVYAQAGVRTVRIYLADHTRRYHPAEIAVVEDLRGELSELCQDPAAVAPALAELRAHLEAMRAHRRTEHGRIAHLAEGRRPADPPERRAYVQGQADLAEAARVVPEVAAVRDRAAELLDERAAAVSPRTSWSLIHGELDDGHVMVAPDGGLVLVDIEGSQFGDVEDEHYFLNLRFGDDRYAHLRLEDLDKNRTRLYQLTRTLSLIAGPMRLVDTDFPNREYMRQIARWNTERLLKLTATAVP
jgi:hypothetical protein